MYNVGDCKNSEKDGPINNIQVTVSCMEATIITMGSIHGVT